MAKIGLSKPYCAKYSNTGETVNYSGGALMGKAVELSIELEGADDNILYADNGPAESANTFAGGTWTLTTDDLLPDVMLRVLGIIEQAMTGSDVSTKDAKWYIWNDEQETPYLGFGAVVKTRKTVQPSGRRLYCRRFSRPTLTTPSPHRAKRSSGGHLKSAVVFCAAMPQDTLGR